MIRRRKATDFDHTTTEDNGNVLGWYRGADCSGECVDWDFIEFTRDEWDMMCYEIEQDDLQTEGKREVLFAMN